MKNFLCVCFLLSLAILFSCRSKKVVFEENELKWLGPFSRNDTAIFNSTTGLADTIIFYQSATSKHSVRNLEQGSYDSYHKSVQYQLTDSSYHKFIQPNGRNEMSFFITIDKYSNAGGSIGECAFLGLLFSREYMKNISKENGTTFTFKKSDSEYYDVNIKEGIIQFEFDFKKGITGFIDKNNNEWKRLN